MGGYASDRGGLYGKMCPAPRREDGDNAGGGLTRDSEDVQYWKSKAAEMHALALEKDGEIQSEATVQEREDIMRELSAARTVLCLSVSPLRLEWCLKRLGHEGNHEIVNAEGVASAGWRNRRDG